MMGFGYAGAGSCPLHAAGGYGLGGYGGGWLFPLVGGVFWMLLLVLTVVLVVWLVRRPRPQAIVAGAYPSSRAVEIARDRYARGEIDREQFERLSEDLR